MLARIYQPPKSSLQSGWANTQQWILEFEPELPRESEPLMGWTSSADPTTQVRLRFDSKEEAIAYAERHGIPYQVFMQRERRVPKKSYADNFAYDRVGQWTH
jgi:hypothetical protein